MEDKNFALFNYVNELNTEVETLQEQIAMTEQEIEKTKQKDVEETENKKEQIEKLEVSWLEAGMRRPECV